MLTGKQRFNVVPDLGGASYTPFIYCWVAQSMTANHILEDDDMFCQ